MRRIEIALAWIFGTIFLVLSFIVTIETISRKVFNFSLQGADELGGYSLAIGSTIAFCLALVGAEPHPRRRLPRTVPAPHEGGAELAVDRGHGRGRHAVRRGLAAGAARKPGVRQHGPDPVGDTADLSAGLWYLGLVLFMLVAVGFASRATWLLFRGGSTN